MKNYSSSHGTYRRICIPGVRGIAHTWPLIYQPKSLASLAGWKGSHSPCLVRSMKVALIVDPCMYLNLSLSLTHTKIPPLTYRLLQAPDHLPIAFFIPFHSRNRSRSHLNGIDILTCLQASFAAYHLSLLPAIRFSRTLRFFSHAQIALPSDHNCINSLWISLLHPDQSRFGLSTRLWAQALPKLTRLRPSLLRRSHH